MNSITILPAVDLKEGKCVRLKQGRAEEVTVYANDPVQMAQHWEAEGARYLHVVDLDGAFQGQPVHRDVICRMAEVLSIPMEVGGGLRTDKDIRILLDHGVDRVVIGTKACLQSDYVEHMVEKFGRKIVVGIDAFQGKVQVKGWTETTDLDAVELAKKVNDIGIETIIYTDTARDGMMEGTNTLSVQALCEAVSCSVIASGGVSSVDDIKRLEALQQDNLVGAIVGKALYEKTIRLADLMKREERPS
ncbi:MAG: 1-(5-phosphoribosyl)-5-[(5-phosphoribosylamino)methylideneamino]imidazole-4-carboxamide isomerase [Kiritimatiellae bacterium]|nr:1-(5-phosphoribosyl)-5-[(5-phosphoribosylamino)methylideneamino]imidazole-4-carboxamide isomerase [Kiritimatiellia bacterium]